MSSTKDPQILRAKAFALMKEAEAIDGLKPYLISHRHEFGMAGYIGWANTEVTTLMASSILDSPFEEGKGKFLSIEDRITLDELTGVLPSSLMLPPSGKNHFLPTNDLQTALATVDSAGESLTDGVTLTEESIAAWITRRIEDSELALGDLAQLIGRYVLADRDELHTEIAERIAEAEVERLAFAAENVSVKG